MGLQIRSYCPVCLNLSIISRRVQGHGLPEKINTIKTVGPDFGRTQMQHGNCSDSWIERFEKLDGFPIL